MRSFRAASYFIRRPGEKQAEVLMCWEVRKQPKSGPSKCLLGFPSGRRDHMDKQL